MATLSTSALEKTAPLRLLIVEDEPMVAWDLADRAHYLGYKISQTVATEDAAMEAVLRFDPDIILMDYRLAGGGDGLTAARRIRETKNTPIIFCTAYVGGSLRTELDNLPRTRLIGKPVCMSWLRDALVWAANSQERSARGAKLSPRAGPADLKRKIGSRNTDVGGC